MIRNWRIFIIGFCMLLLIVHSLLMLRYSCIDTMINWGLSSFHNTNIPIRHYVKILGVCGQLGMTTPFLQGYRWWITSNYALGVEVLCVCVCVCVCERASAYVCVSLCVWCVYDIKGETLHGWLYSHPRPGSSGQGGILKLVKRSR